MSAEALANHPFCRVPAVQTGVTPWASDPERASNRGLATCRLDSLLLQARVLLAKDSLCEANAHALVLLVERLAAYCYYFQRAVPPRRYVNQAAERLAFRFLLLDAIVSGLIPTGQRPSAAWWQRLAELTPHDSSRTAQGKHSRKSCHGGLARGFGGALGPSPRGNCSSPEVLYQSKYTSFCAQPPLHRFRRSYYDSWRGDCDGSGKSSQHGAGNGYSVVSICSKENLA